MRVVFNCPKEKEKTFVTFDEIEIGNFFLVKEQLLSNSIERLFIKADKDNIMVISDNQNFYPQGYTFESGRRHEKIFMVVDVNMEVFVKAF